MEETQRYLSIDEIEDICSSLQKPSAILKGIQDMKHDQVIENLKKLLAAYSIKPSKIPKLKDQIINQYMNSLIVPGTPSGLLISESNGQPLTQLTLNTFHKAGSMQGNPIDLYREMIYLRKERTNPIVFTHFKNKNMSYREILNISTQFVSHSFSDFVEDLSFNRVSPDSVKFFEYFNGKVKMTKKEMEEYREYTEARYEISLIEDEILDYLNSKDKDKYTESLVNSKKGGSSAIDSIKIDKELYNIEKYERFKILEKKYEDIGDISQYPNFSELDPWYSFYSSKIFSFDEPKYWMRIRLDRNLMYASKFVISDFYKALLRSDFSEKLTFIPSPTEIGMIDVFVNQSTNEDRAILQKLSSEIRKMGSEISLQGIPGIYQIDVETYNCMKLITGCEQDYSYESSSHAKIKDHWRLWISVESLRTCGFSLEDKIYPLLSLLPGGGVQIVTDNFLQNKDALGISGYVIVKYPDENPLDVLKKMISDEKLKQRENALLDRKSGGGGEYMSDVIRYSEYNYALLSGDNLKEVMVHPLVDQRYTICNNYYQILQTFGIETLYNWICYEISSFFELNDISISYNHISDIADVMTSLGVPTPISSRGMLKYKRGVFSDASFENSQQAIRNNVAFSKPDKVNSISTSILFGVQAQLGTGSVKFMRTPKEKRVSAPKVEEAPAPARRKVAAKKTKESKILEDDFF